MCLGLSLVKVVKVPNCEGGAAVGRKREGRDDAQSRKMCACEEASSQDCQIVRNTVVSRQWSPSPRRGGPRCVPPVTKKTRTLGITEFVHGRLRNSCQRRNGVFPHETTREEFCNFGMYHERNESKPKREERRSNEPK